MKNSLLITSPWDLRLLRLNFNNDQNHMKCDDSFVERKIPSYMGRPTVQDWQIWRFSFRELFISTEVPWLYDCSIVEVVTCLRSDS